MADKTPWDQYSEYLSLEKILDAQKPLSDAAGAPAHDEMLFIHFHQICELWFKQILFEMDDIEQRFSRDIVAENDMQPILSYLNRIIEILKQLEQMIDVLETMPPQSFIDFREYFGTASGFQSLQFRLIEGRLGLRREDRLKVFHGHYDDHLRKKSQQAIKDVEDKASLYDLLELWLSRTPFVDLENYNFWDEYKQAVYKMFDEKTAIAKKHLEGATLDKELAGIERGREKFESIFDADMHEKAKEDGQWRMSYKALQAALFITIYRTEPALQVPYKLLNHIMDVDELLTRWRLRHALMTQRMMGMSVGSGGSSGFEYLMQTIGKHRIFTDLFALSTYIIPSPSIPDLPDEVKRKMTYNFAAE